MSISGFLMYGSAQKNKIISASAFAFLAVYLALTSTVVPFLYVNLAIIFFISILLKRINNQIISSMSIIFYSVIIDIICFFAFPSFSAGISLAAYIWSGILFNLKSSLPVFAFASIMNLAEFINSKYFLAQKLLLNRGII